MDRPAASKPSLSQQLLRSFRPRASTTAAPFTTSATASPISTPIDHAFSSELGSNGSSITAFNSAAVLDQNANLLARSESFTLSDYQAYIDELRQPLPAEAGSEQEAKSVTDRLSRLHVLIYATNKRIEEEQSQDEDKITEKDLQQVLSTPASSGPPQAEVFKMCLHLLLQAREGLLPLSLRLGVCELATASVKLSDIRAMKGTKAVRETRSGAPGSQSSKVIDADHPLANIDRAALYDLVCHLSDGYEAEVLTRENWQQSQLPALPVQLKALEVLSLEGRDVVSFPGILDFLSRALEIVWRELQILRRLPGSEDDELSEEDGVRLAEQLSAREWSLMATLQLITSIIKCGFAMLDLDRVETVLTRIAGMFLGSSHTIAVTISPRLRALVRSRSKSRERKPLTEGYDYYGLESATPMDQSRSASPTPKSANTPKLGAKVETSSIAPIALATLAPASSSGSSFPPTSSQHLPCLDQQPILQTSDVRAVLLLIDTIIRFGSIPNGSVDSVTKILCCILGYPDPSFHVRGVEKGVDWTPLLLPVLQNLLKGHCANASIRCARSMLINSGDVSNSQAVILVGSIDFLRNALYLVAKHGGSSQIGMSGSNPNDSALAPSLSLPLLLPALEGALQRHMDVLDLHVLRLVSDMLPLKDSPGRRETVLFASSPNSEDWDSLLNLTVVARRHTEGWKLKGDEAGLLVNQVGLNGQAQNGRDEAQPSAVVGAMLDLVSRLRLGAPNGIEDSMKDAEKPPSLPWTPKLAALLLSLAPLLPGDLMQSLISFYKANDLCLPCTPEWITNIRALLTASFHRHDATDPGQQQQTPSPTTLARRSLVSLIFGHVYEIVQDFSEHRSTLMLEVILPLSQSTLGAETDEVVESTIRTVLTEGAATAISQSHVAAVEAGKEEEAHAVNTKDKDQVIFEDVCNLFCRLARSSSTSVPTRNTGAASKGHLPPHVSFIDPPGSHERKPLTRSHSTAGSVNGVSALPLSKTTKQCRSALNLIAIINKLAFSSPWALLSLSLAKDQEISHNLWEKGAREACIHIFRRLLELMQPEGQEVPAVPVRLTILQWLVRLRTDRQHRVYLAENLEELITPAANSIGRGVVSPSEAPVADVESRTRASKRDYSLLPRDGSRDRSERSTSRAERSISRMRDSSRDRGRLDQSPRLGTERDRSSSRTRSGISNGVHAASPRKLPALDSPPLWRLPDVVSFEVPGSRLRSDVVYSYTHPEWETDGSGLRHGGLSKQGEPPASLPISEYMTICIAILTKEKDWDLVSYLLCHLPHQLGTKHLFCGPKAQKQIVALREMLTNKILEQKFLNQVTLPEKVKSSDVYAIAYGTLTTLISYRTLFSRSQQDELVEAFMTGLNKSSNTAQPCVRALSVCCYELQKSINRHLPKMLVKLTMVMSSTAMSVHILELIASIAQLPDLYANFTDTDFRRIFGIALQYIQYHNQDQQTREEDQISFNATSFTLAQYVLMLAYYNICLWFISLRFSDRLKHVESIRKGLLAANQGRGQVSDQTEVCFDFLARFSYSNANARPRQSYLNKIIKASNASAATKTYLFGKSLLTVASFTKFGGAEVLIRRSSGTLALTCKVENAFASQLPDENGERVELPATLMMNRPIAPSSLSEWTRHQLNMAEQARIHGHHGPARLGLVKRGRSASFSGGTRGDNNEGFRVVQGQVDAYSAADKSVDEEEIGTTVHLESKHLEKSMREVLGSSTDEPINGTSDDTHKQQAAKSTSRAAGPTTAKEFQMDPGFIALQLSSFPDTTGNAPILLPNEASTQRLIRSIDLTPVVDFHKIGVLYVGSGQTEEKEILGNRSGSRNYTNFLSSLGELVTLKGQQDVYTGGLDIRNDEHGKYTYVWGDDISQIVYHVTTLMPNNVAQDENHSGKKALIGNDWVRIVWNESGREYDFDTIKTQFNFINIVISPNSRGGGEVGSFNASDTVFYRVSLQTIEGLPTFSPVGDGQLISASNLGNFVKTLALNSNLVSQIFVATNGRESGSQYSYTSNWVSRLHHIERARLKLETSTNKEAASAVPATNSAAQSASAAPALDPAGTNGTPAATVEEGEGNYVAYDISRF